VIDPDTGAVTVATDAAPLDGMRYLDDRVLRPGLDYTIGLGTAPSGAANTVFIEFAQAPAAVNAAVLAAFRDATGQPDARFANLRLAQTTVGSAAHGAGTPVRNGSGAMRFSVPGTWWSAGDRRLPPISFLLGE
jgi:hypothetical protein